jgi:DNA-binding NarL/FixJ family response regulator
MFKTLVLVRDLMFASKISATAKAAAAEIEMLRDPSALAGKSADRLIIDLNQPGTLEAAIAWKALDPNRKVIGFVSHTDRQTIAAAESAGIDQIMPRSQFVASLDMRLRS